MEFWEGAILVVGGVWLVSHMASKANPGAGSPTVIGANSTSWLGALGVSNQSNLTNITNQAGGQPTVAGEPLLYQQPQIYIPGTPARIIPPPIAQPIHMPVSPVSRLGVIVGAPVRVPTAILSPARTQML